MTRVGLIHIQQNEPSIPPDDVKMQPGDQYANVYSAFAVVSESL